MPRLAVSWRFRSAKSQSTPLPAAQCKNDSISKSPLEPKSFIQRETSQVDLTMDLIANLPTTQTVIRGQLLANLERLQKRFIEVAGDRGEVQLEQFKQIMNCENDHFLDRLFAFFDRDDSGFVSKQEFLESIQKVILKPDDDKIEFLFFVYDLNGDQLISSDELKLMMQACMSENKLYFSETQIEQLVQVLLEDADLNNDQSISYEEFRRLILRKPGLHENLAISIERWLLPSPPDLQSPASAATNALVRQFPILRKCSWHYMRNNRVSVTFFFVWLLINVCLAMERVHFYGFVMHSGWPIIVARICGQCLNFNGAFVLLLMVRKSITFLRSLRLSDYLPLDQHIYFHKLVGWAILAFSLAHAGAHTFNVLSIVQETKLPLSHTLFGFELGIGWMGSAYVTGWTLVIILLVMIISSLNFVRRKDHFEVFYYCHLLYVPFFIVCLLHAPRFWLWLLMPGLLFLIEQIIRFRHRGQPTFVREGTILPSEVLHLVIERPPNFHYKPGDWVFVKIPEIARREWHPFTISAAPERPDHALWLHIRVCGEWTRRLYQKYLKFENVQVVCCDQPRMPITDVLGSMKFEPSDFTIGQMNKGFQSDTHTIASSNGGVGGGGSSDAGFRSLQPSPFGSVDPLTTAAIDQERIADCIALTNLPGGKNCRLFNECPRSVVQQRNKSANQLAPLSMLNTRPTSWASEPNSINATPRPEQRKTVRFPLRVLLDGPYGSPSSDIFQTEHALLIAPGIGVTPFASILQSIVHRYEQSRHQCPQCDHVFTEPRPASLQKLRKVDFVWINRDQRCFEWFVQLMAELELTQQRLAPEERFLDMHVYVSSARDASDMKAIGLQLALDLLHERHQRDLITGLKTRTRPGRPNWDVFFNDIAKQKKGKVTVFFCGGALMGRELQTYCQKYGFAFRKEHF